MILGLLASWAPTVPQAAEQIATPDILPGEVVHFKTTWLDGGALLYAGTSTSSGMAYECPRRLKVQVPAIQRRARFEVRITVMSPTATG